MRRYSIFRPVDDQHRVMLDAEFEHAGEAQAFLDIMRTRVWPDPDKAPAKIGAARTSIVEMVETHDY